MTGDGLWDAEEAETQRRAVEQMLARDGDAHLGAIDQVGMFTAIPEDVPLGRGHRPIVGVRALIDLVTHADGPAIIDAWELVKVSGSSRCTVRLRAAPEDSLLVRCFDVRAGYGVFLVLLTPAGADITDQPMPDLPVAVTRPRVARITKDEAAVITAIDDATTVILGFSPEEMVGRRSLQFIHPEDHPAAIDNWIDMLTTPEHVQRVRVRHLRSDGGYQWVELSNNNRIGDAGRGDVLSEIYDISDEMAAVEALREREELLNRLTEALPLALLHVDADLGIIYRNHRVCEMTLVDDAATLSEQLVRLDDDTRTQLQEAAGHAIGTGEPGQLEVELVLDVRRVYDVRIRAVDGADGQIGGALLCMTDITASAELRSKLHDRATYDSLTGCLNRESTMAALIRMLAAPSTGLAVIYLDLDGFKQVNDQQGHAAGDDVLRSVAGRLRGIVRANDVVGRLGGDEFLVISPSVSSAEEARLLAARLETAVTYRRAADDSSAAVGATAGSAWTMEPGGPAEADALVARADGAMYESKNRKRRDLSREAPAIDNRFRPDRATALFHALDNGEFELHYQPIMNLRSGEIWGAEALLRWRNGNHILPAATFIDVAERSGAIAEIGEWTRSELCRHIDASRDAVPRDFRWFLNISPQELARDAAGSLIDGLTRHRLAPGSVVVEISERADLLADSHVIDAIGCLAAAGVEISLDDFGTGWSTLAVLRSLPLRWLKADRSLVAGMGMSTDADQVIRSILELGERLAVGVIIPGVERVQQHDQLTELGAELVQGHRFAPALPGADLARLLAKTEPDDSGDQHAS